MKLIIAQCTDKKRRGTHKAKDLYMPSDLFKAQRRYYEAYADHCKILSGKYGLVRPGRKLDWYDMHINEQTREHFQERRDKFFELLADGKLILAWNVPLPPREVEDVHVELICGHEDYATKLIWYLEEYDIPYSEPFKGMGIGKRTKQMKQEARKVENKTLENYV